MRHVPALGLVSLNLGLRFYYYYYLVSFKIKNISFILQTCIIILAQLDALIKSEEHSYLSKQGNKKLHTRTYKLDSQIHAPTTLQPPEHSGMSPNNHSHISVG